MGLLNKKFYPCPNKLFLMSLKNQLTILSNSKNPMTKTNCSHQCLVCCLIVSIDCEKSIPLDIENDEELKIKEKIRPPCKPSTKWPKRIKNPKAFKADNPNQSYDARESSGKKKEKDKGKKAVSLINLKVTFNINLNHSFILCLYIHNLITRNPNINSLE